MPRLTQNEIARNTAPDFPGSVSRGQIEGYTAVYKFGRNDALGTSIEDIWNVGGTYPFVSQAVTIELISDSNADSATGAGAQVIYGEGLDTDFSFIAGSIELAGTDAVTFPIDIRRVHRFYVSRTGTYGDTTTTPAQAGTITVRIASAGSSLGVLHSDDGIAMGQSLQAIYTIPKGKTGYLLNADVDVDTAKNATLYVFKRENAGNTVTGITSKRIIHVFDGVGGATLHKFEHPVTLPSQTDVWICGIASATGTKVHASFDVLLKDDD